MLSGATGSPGRRWMIENTSTDTPTTTGTVRAMRRHTNVSMRAETGGAGRSLFLHAHVVEEREANHAEPEAGDFLADADDRQLVDERVAGGGVGQHLLDALVE